GLAVFVVGLGIPALRFGTDVLFAYLTRVLPEVSAAYSAETANISLWTVGPRLFRGTEGGALAGTPPLVASHDAERVVGVAIPLLVVCLAVLWLRSHPPLGYALGVMTCV